MATIAKLIADGALFEIEADLDPGVQPQRYLYAIPDFRRFLNSLPTLESCWHIEQTPEEQFDDLLNEFLGTEPLATGWRFGPLYPARGKPWPGVWELKTPDLRVFGWFCSKDHFVAVDGCDATKVKEYELYGGFRDAVIRCRDVLPLDEPKFVGEENYEDVISLFYRT